VECRGYFCRECITEHEGRILCGNCLQASVAPAAKPKARLLCGLAGPALAAVAGVVVAWYCFFMIGRGLLSIPSDFHPETLWAGKWQIGGGGDE
jgi:hypothetical protein